MILSLISEPSSNKVLQTVQGSVSFTFKAQKEVYNNGVTSSNNKLLPVKGEVRCNPSLPGPPSPCGQSVGPF